MPRSSMALASDQVEVDINDDEDLDVSESPEKEYTVLLSCLAAHRQVKS